MARSKSGRVRRRTLTSNVSPILENFGDTDSENFISTEIASFVPRWAGLSGPKTGLVNRRYARNTQTETSA